MKNYIVSIPLTASVVKEVKAESEEEAIEKAFQDASLEDIDEWDVHKEVVTGNVFHGILNRAFVEED